MAMKITAFIVFGYGSDFNTKHEAYHLKTLIDYQLGELQSQIKVSYFLL